MKSMELITNATFFQKPMAKILNYAMITALATGVAALPFFSLKYFKHFLAKYNALAGGLMLSASFNVIFEGFKKLGSEGTLRVWQDFRF